MLTEKEMEKVERNTMLFGHRTVSNYIRSIVIADIVKNERATRKRAQKLREEEERQRLEAEEERKLMEEFNSL